jgi:hypothetical protein
MKAIQAIASALKYVCLARLVGRGWFHHDMYWDVETADERERHLEQAHMAIMMFSQSCAVNRVIPAVFKDDQARHEPDICIRETKAQLYECAVILKKNRPFIVRHLLGLMLVGSVFLSMAIWCSSILILLCSNNGLTVSYFDGTHFDKKVMEWTERSVMKDYGSGRPCLLCPRKNYSAKWEGVVAAPRTDEYSFYAQSKGGLRLIIDDDIIIDHLDKHDWTPGKHGNKTLAKGEHRICIEYYNTRGNGALRVRWCGGGIPPNTVIGEPFLKKR